MSVTDYLASVAVTGLGLLYPGYMCFKAVKRENVAAMKAWLQYWLVLSVMAALMLLLEPLLYHRLPLYNVAKIAALAYLVLPMTKGYKQVYDMVILPNLDKHEGAIDEAADMFVKASTEQARNLGPKVNDLYARGVDMATKATKKK